MKRFLLSLAVGLIAFTALYSFTQAQNNTAGMFIIEQPYAFATTKTAKTAAAFFVLNNQTDTDRILIEAQSDVAEIVELHQNLIDPDDGQMMMRRVKEIIAPAKDEAILKPTGYHVMFINLNAPLNVGDVLPVTLKFKDGSEEIINVNVIAPGTKPIDLDGHDHHDHNH